MNEILAIDIGGSSIKYAYYTINGNLSYKNSFSVPKSYNELIEKIESIFRGGNFQAITVSSPGGVDTKTGQGYGLSAIEYIPSGGNLKFDLETRLNTTVAIENDANCAALSELHFGDGSKSIAYIVLGTGVGGALIINGQVVTGHNFYGGEFGYIPYKDSTISAYGGMSSLINRVSDRSEELSGIEIFEKYDQKIEKYVNAVDQYYDAIAHLISIIKYTVNPEKVVFAGGICSRTTFISEIKEAMNRVNIKKIDTDLSDVNVEVGKFKEDANLYGAYANLIRNYQLDIKA